MRFYAWALEDPPEGELTVRLELGEAQILAGELSADRGRTLPPSAAMSRSLGRPRELGG